MASSTSSRRWPGPTFSAFGIAFAGTLAIALDQGAKTFYYDSANYWALGETFFRHGHFSLLNFNDPLRGYLLPLIDHVLQVTGAALKLTSSAEAKVFNALIFSLIGAVLAPRLAEIAWPEQRWGILRRVAVVALLIVFWSGYLNFPLSDFPALAMVLVALVATARWDTPGWALLAGVATGVAIDMRPSYVLLAPIVVALFAWEWFGGRSAANVLIARRTLCVGLLAIGFVVVSLPQSLSSNRHFHIWSPIPGSPAHLTRLQLTEGLRVQDYETYIGSGHPPQMVYEDAAGRVLQDEQKNHLVNGAGPYLELIASHPIAMAGIFVRHFVNGLDQRYSTPYIEHLDTGSRRWSRLAGFLIVFLGLVRLLWPVARRSLGRARWRYPLALALCCLTSLPSSMETRFLLPVYLLSYLLVLAPGWPNPIGPANLGIRRFRTLVVIVLAYLAFMAVVWHIVSSTTSNLHFGG